MRVFLKLFKGYGAELIVAILLGAMTSAGALGLLGLSGGFLTATAIAGMSVVTAEAFDIVLSPGAIRLFALMRTVGRWAERIVSHEVTFKFLSRLRSWIYGVFCALSLRQIGNFHSAEVLNRFTKDIDALEHITLRLFVPMGSAIIIFALFMGVFGIKVPELLLPIGTFTLVMLIVIPFLAFKIGRSGARKLSRGQGELRTVMMDTVDTLEDLSLHQPSRARQVEKVLVADGDRARELLHLSRRSAGLRALVLWITGMMALLVISVVVTLNSLDGPWKVALVFLVLGAVESVLILPQAWVESAGTFDSAKRLSDLSKQTPGVVFLPEDSEKPVGSALVVDNLSFGYDFPVISDLSLHIPQGTHLAITGPSGGGKSSFVKLITRLEDPLSGKITLGGVDLRNLSEGTLRGMVACAPQDPWLFRRPLSENLRIAAPDASDEELWKALETVGIKQTVENWPNALETWIEEDGANLSGGQRRRLVIARTILAPGQVVVLDEPTEGLDDQAAQELSTMVRAHLKGRTLVWVTHRRPEILGFDKELILGEIGRT